MKAEVLKNLRQELSNLWRESYGVRQLVAAVSVAGCLSVSLSLFFIWITKRIVDAVVSPSHDIPSPYVVALVGCLVMQLVIPAIRSRIEVTATTRYADRLRGRLLGHILQSKWMGRQGIHTGDAINRMQKDVDTLAVLTCSTFPGVFVVILQLAGAFVFLALLDARLAVALVFIMPVALAASKIYIRKTRRLTDEIRKDESGMQTFLQESLHHRTLLSTLMSADMLLRKFNLRQSSLTDKIVRRSDISIFSNMVVSAGFMTGYAVVFLWSAYGLATGMVSFGMMTAFLQLVGQVQRPVVNLSHHVPAFINALVSLERIGGITSLPLEDFSQPKLPDRKPKGLRLCDVTYSYPDEEGKRVVERLTYDFKPGSVTGIIGPTGAGKTTLLRLLLGLVEPTFGKASVYCDDSCELKIGAGLRRSIVYVPQGNTLVYGSIRDNLLLGNPNATELMMSNALRIAAAEFVMTLPKGMDTECFEGGVGLSEGQAQRIAIARGLLKGGNIFLLDEPTSSLDTATEREFMTRLVRNIPASTTVIIVTHRRQVTDYCTDVLDLTEVSFHASSISG